MRRTLWPLLLLVAVAACSKGSPSSGPAKTFRVAAASDLAKAFDEVGKAYTKQSGVTPVFDFGSSGLLAKQIEQGAPFSLFAAANKNFAEQVVKTGKCDGSSIQLYSRGRIILWGKAGTPAKIEELVDPKYKRIGIANPDHAPYGKAAVEAMQKAGIYDQVKDRLVLAENVQAAQTYAKEGQVDVSFSALSLAIANDSAGYLAIAPDLHTPLEQSMVVCGKGPEADAAREFAKFVVGDAGRAIMERYGFSTTGVLPQEMKLRPETLAAKAVHAVDPATGGIVPPITLATTYARDANYQLIADRDYARDKNPTYLAAETTLAALEHGAEARVFASGMAAATVAVRSIVKPGDHVVAPRVGYYAFRNWLARFCAKWQVALDIVDMTDLDVVRAAIKKGTTRLVWIETPANPTWDVTDISAVAQLAHDAGAVVVVDSTCATPVHTQPLTLGADLVMHSATKYLGGHSDVLAGALVTKVTDLAWTEIAQTRHDEGALLGPVEAWLLLRGMRTLYARVERQSRTAQSLAERLARLPDVAVHYPGLRAHPQYAVAHQQMQRGFGGMLSIRVGARDPLDVVKKLRVWLPATSLGGVESLVEHRATVEGPASPTPKDLLRLSVGLEHEEDLFEDLSEALA